MNDVSAQVASLFQTIDKLSHGGPRANREGVFKVRRWLTEDRSRLPTGYMNDPRNFSAYLCYHLPLHLPEAFWIFDRCFGPRSDWSAPKSLLDIGCGPGTASLSLLLWLRYRALVAPERLNLVDISSKALDGAEALSRSIGFEGRVDKLRVIRATQARLPVGMRSDCAIVSHVLNEFGNGPRYRQAKLDFLMHHFENSVEDGGTFLIVEPPLREPTLDLMWLRDQIFEMGIEILGPCPPGVERCPMLATRAGWCYAQPDRTWAKQRNLAPGDSIMERTFDVTITHPGFSYLLLRKQSAADAAAYDHVVSVTDQDARPGQWCTPKGLIPGLATERGAWAQGLKPPKKP